MCVSVHVYGGADAYPLGELLPISAAFEREIVIPWVSDVFQEPKGQVPLFLPLDAEHAAPGRLAVLQKRGKEAAKEHTGEAHDGGLDRQERSRRNEADTKATLHVTRKRN